jgi:hypothetical protein
MAKTPQALFPLSGTLAGLTFVQSGTYGNHVRRARGTVKPAPVNKVLRQNAGRAGKITDLAKPLLQCFKEMGGSFIQRGLWQVIMKRMFKAGSTSVNELLLSLEGLELNKTYPVEKILGTVLPVKVSVKNTRVNVQLAPFPKPVFHDGRKIDSYRCEVFVTWIDSKGSRLEGEAANTKWIELQADAGKLSFNFTKDKWAKYMLIVLKIEGGLKGKPDGNLAGMGMRVVKVVV